MLPYVGFAANRWPAALAAAAIPAACIALPDDFVVYLHTDGLLLPRPAPGARLKPCDPRFGDDFDVRARVLFFIGRAVLTHVNALARFGGSVFAKLNYSAPVDAKWVSASLECRSAGDVFLLLKASDFVLHDLERTTEPCLVLKPWMDVDVRYEFRCFVVRDTLVAASQRDIGQCFPYLCDANTRAKLWRRLRAFCHDAVIPNFASQGRAYCADVVVAQSGSAMLLIDVGPVPEHSLVPASALEGDPGPVPLFYVASEADVDRAADRALAMHRVPLELVTGDLASMDDAFLRMQAQR